MKQQGRKAYLQSSRLWGLMSDKMVAQSGRRIMVITLASQAKDDGSIPFARSSNRHPRLTRCPLRKRLRCL